MSWGRRQGDLAVIPPEAAVPDGRPYVLTVPGASAPLYRFDLPKGVTGSSRRRIARQQLEERIGRAEGPLDLIPVGRSSDWDHAVVCNAENRRDWAAQAQAAAPNCRAILPDYLTLPALSDGVVIDQRGQSALVRIGENDGFTAPLSLTPALLQQALRHSAATRAVVAKATDDGILTVLRAQGITISATGLDDPDAALPARLTGTELSADLRLDPTAGASNAPGALVWWLAAAAVALLAFGMWSGAILMEARKAEVAAADLRARGEAVLRQGLVPSGPILDVRQQVTRALQQADAGGAPEDSPLKLLSRVTLAVFGKGVEVTSLRLAAGQGIALTIVAADFAAVDALVSDMRQAGLEAQALASRVLASGGVEARLDVRGGSEKEQ